MKCVLILTVLTSVVPRIYVQESPTTMPCNVSDDIIMNQPLRIGAWNVQKLGKTKMSKPNVVDVIIKVMYRYDIIVIQEILDISETVPYDLLFQLNHYVFDMEGAVELYGLVLSGRLGRTSYKEQYGFFYRKDVVTVSDTFQYPDLSDMFQIEPFIVIFETPTTDLDKIALIPIHTSPKDAVEEIDALTDVYDALVGAHNIKDALILGDFNAGCNYVTESDWMSIRLFTESRFKWLINDHQDTTAKRTTCPYDRIVLVGNDALKSVYEFSAKPFYFDDEFDVSDLALVYSVSDHFPVEVLLKGKFDGDLESNLSTSIAVSIDFTTSTNFWDDLITQCHLETLLQPQLELICQNLTFVVTESSIVIMEFDLSGIDDTIDLLEHLSDAYSCSLPREVTAILVCKLSHGVLKDASLYGDNYEVNSMKTRISCINLDCSIDITKGTQIN